MFRWRPVMRPKNYTVKDLWRKGDKLLRKGKTAEAKEALLAAAQSHSPIDRHYAYVKLIRLLQSTTDQNDELVEICRQDIDLFPEFYEAWMLEYLNNVPTPYFPSFSVLADIYEQQGKHTEALSLCELAIGYGLAETIGEDFPEKMERLLTTLKHC